MGGPFKQYVRGQRALTTEENYARGMYYTLSPLQVGFSRVLANYDHKDNGDVLIPRPGFRTVDYARLQKNSAVTHTTQQLIAGQVCDENGVKLRQVLAGFSDQDKLQVITVYEAATNKTYNTEIPLLEYHVEDLADVANPTTYINYADPTGIHNMPATIPFRKHVGAFCFEKSYYYFRGGQLYHTVYDVVNQCYKGEAVTPRTVSPKEAVTWGYNMLQTNPYTFSNTINATVQPIALLGILPYNLAGNLELSPQVNQTLNLECFFTGQLTKVYNITWEWKETGATAWSTLKTEQVTLAAATRLVCEFSAPGKNIIARVTATNTTDNTDLKVLAVALNFNKSEQGAATNAKLETYNLAQASIMTYWRNRVVLAHKTNLFLSDLNDPSYFPYPANMEPFEETILKVTAMMDMLLVFTTSKLYTITLNADGLSWTKRCIQTHLNIRQADVHLIQVVKSMVFFKSGNYFYMVVPQVATGSLSIAPISKPLDGLFDNFPGFVADYLNKLYDYRATWSIKDYYSHLDFEDVHMVYTLQLEEGKTINLTLLYNITSRTWRVYSCEGAGVMIPYQVDATKKGIYMAFVKSSQNRTAIQFMQYTPTNNVDTYLTGENETVDGSGNITAPETVTVYKNYQLLDTGYREQASDYKKRYREAQLKINNISQERLEFYTEFYVDGDARKTMFRYDIVQDVDPVSPEFGLITLSRSLVDPDIVPSITVLAENAPEVNCWTLDMSRFPDIAFWKIRIPISGKGYAPRMLLISYNERAFEILNNSWVARQLNAR